MNSKENNMKKLLVVVGLAAAVAFHPSVVHGAGKDKEKEVIYLSADSATFVEAMPGVSMAAVWGDSKTGAHGSFTKFAPGHDAGMHTHTNDIWCVVLKGAYLYKDDAGEKRVGPGEFIRILGGHKHWSGGDKTEGALFYEEAKGKFDLIPAK